MRLLVLIFFVMLAGHGIATSDERTEMRFLILDDEKAWQRLPQAKPPLPTWAKMLTPSLPQTDTHSEVAKMNIVKEQRG